MSEAMLPCSSPRWLASSPARAVIRFAETNATVVSVGLALVMGLGDFLTNVEITFTLLYLVPVMTAAWWRGRPLAVFVTSVCVAIALTSEIVARIHNQRPFHPFRMVWNHGGSFLIFLFVATVVLRLRAYVEKEREERRSTAAQLRQAERLGAIGKMAAGIAHELGTPLNVIAGYAEIVASDRATPARLATASSVILAQTKKMTSIIRGLLDFSRRAGAERADVDLDAIARSAAAMLTPAAEKSKVAIEVDSAGQGKAIVNGNALELEQVLVNLMMNGIQAMPNGGTLRVHVRDSARDPEAEDAAAPSSVASLEVEDDGVGIATESLGMVFDPFYTTRDVGDGTGLGLSVSYGIVCDHGGRIEVSSAVGEGSRFSVYLPRAHVERQMH
jgi:signal transduction histidine kinase